MTSQNEVDDMIKRIQTSKGVQGRLIRSKIHRMICLFVFLLFIQD